MATKAKVGATNWDQAIKRALSANEAGRLAMDQLLHNSDAGPGPRALLYAKIANALAGELAALTELQRIGDGGKGGNGDNST